MAWDVHRMHPGRGVGREVEELWETKLLNIKEKGQVVRIKDACSCENCEMSIGKLGVKFPAHLTASSGKLVI